MNKEKIDEFKLELASRMAAILYPDNFPDSVVETAKQYRALGGQDLGIKELQKTADKVNKRKWYHKLFKS